ncbi:MAG TPA: hypothetical protein PKE64_14325 [Anaerolineae bacterium]|nr:hypothetical protein [Anaerolineae bacterium]HMR65179.1 hypothetical protein [Anaerolineae bacterium]
MTTAIVERLAQSDFERMRWKAVWRNWFSWLRRTCNCLVALSEIWPCLPAWQQHDVGLQVVPLEKIIGSEGRAQDFDRTFALRHDQTQERWIRIDQAYYEQRPLPPVSLIKINDWYFVRDGNHRVSVARSRGQAFIDAEVTELIVPTSTDLSRCFNV